MLDFLNEFCILINEMQKIIRILTIAVRHAPLGQASYPLARILIFHIFKKTIRRLAILAALQTPPRQECERETEKDEERSTK